MVFTTRQSAVTGEEDSRYYADWYHHGRAGTVHNSRVDTVTVHNSRVDIVTVHNGRIDKA